MKKAILLFTMAIVSLSIQAQTNLRVGALLNDPDGYEKGTKTVWVKSKELKKYKLTVYRSISSENSQMIGKMEKAVIADSKQASDKEIGYIGPHLYFAFLSFPPKSAGQTNRPFIFYRNPSLKNSEKKEATLVYMEGSLTMEEVKKLFK